MVWIRVISTNHQASFTKYWTQLNILLGTCLGCMCSKTWGEIEKINQKCLPGVVTEAFGIICAVYIQWNLSNMDSLNWNLKFVRYPHFRERTICIYVKLGLSQVAWLTKVSLFQRCPFKRGSTVYAERELGWWLLEVIAQLSGHLLLNLARGPGLVPSDCGLFTFFYFTSWHQTSAHY